MTKGTKKQSELLSKGTESTHAEDEPYLYQDSGIAERHGAIPLWLKLVSIGLIVWSIYYTIRYWSGD